MNNEMNFEKVLVGCLERPVLFTETRSDFVDIKKGVLKDIITSVKSGSLDDQLFASVNRKLRLIRTTLCDVDKATIRRLSRIIQQIVLSSPHIGSEEDYISMKLVEELILLQLSYVKAW